MFNGSRETRSEVGELKVLQSSAELGGRKQSCQGSPGWLEQQAQKERVKPFMASWDGVSKRLKPEKHQLPRFHFPPWNGHRWRSVDQCRCGHVPQRKGPRRLPRLCGPWSSGGWGVCETEGRGWNVVDAESGWGKIAPPPTPLHKETLARPQMKRFRNEGTAARYLNTWNAWPVRGAQVLTWLSTGCAPNSRSVRESLGNCLWSGTRKHTEALNQEPDSSEVK